MEVIADSNWGSVRVVAANGYSIPLMIVWFMAVHTAASSRGLCLIKVAQVFALVWRTWSCWRWLPSGARYTPTICMALEKFKYSRSVMIPSLSRTCSVCVVRPFLYFHWPPVQTKSIRYHQHLSGAIAAPLTSISSSHNSNIVCSFVCTSVILLPSDIRSQSSTYENPHNWNIPVLKE